MQLADMGSATGPIQGGRARQHSARGGVNLGERAGNGSAARGSN